MKFKTEGYLFFKHEGAPDTDRTYVYENVSLPDMTLYALDGGDLHFSLKCAGGTPIKVPFLDVHVPDLCLACFTSKEYSKMKNIEQELDTIKYIVQMFRKVEQTFDNVSSDPTTPIAALGDALYSINDIDAVLSFKSNENVYLASFVTTFLSQVAEVHQTIITFLRTKDARVRIEKERAAQPPAPHNSFVANDDDAILFYWSELHGLYRIVAMAYGIDLGNGRGALYLDGQVVSMIENRYYSMVLPGAAGFPAAVFEVAATLWKDNENTSGVLSEGSNLLEIAKVITNHI